MSRVFTVSLSTVFIFSLCSVLRALRALRARCGRSAPAARAFGAHAYDTSLRSVRALRARCGPFGPAAGPPGPLRALRARGALCLAACRCPATRLVLATCLPGYLFTRLQPGCFEWPDDGFERKNGRRDGRGKQRNMFEKCSKIILFFR